MVSSSSHKEFLREKFSKITRRYDLVNSLCSLGQDQRWRRELAWHIKGAQGPILDLCCGPLTLTLELLKANPRQAFALDLSQEMLLYGLTKDSPLLSLIYPVGGDAETLPFQTETFGAVTIAFGFRNLVHRSQALKEIHRVLKKGGLLAILEFAKPKLPLFKGLYLFYLKNILPLIGGALTGEPQAYRYLADSILKFPPLEEVCQMLHQNSFLEVFTKSLTLGVVTLYLWKKP